MWRRFQPRAALAVLLMLAACGSSEPYEYPAGAKAEFNKTCAADNPQCVCLWDEITRAMPYEEYEATLTRFREKGLMDPAITRARAKCTGRG